jgi:L-seryl-tRNA(Ser) seleniumtransferase
MAELIEAGCDLVCGSGDKLLGGPQAGILVGRAPLVAACRKHPLYRALRPDRTTFAALEGVLRLHRAGHPLPLDRLWPDPVEHRGRLERAATDLSAEIVPADAFLGGGSAPEEPVPGEALALPGDDDFLARLRRGQPPHPPVIGYLRQGRLFLDLRTVDPEDDPLLIAAIRRALSS